MEVAAGEHFARIGEHERVVGDRVRLGLEKRGGVAQVVEAGSHHLRLAPDRIGVLDPVAIEVRGADLAAAHQVPKHARDHDLSTVATDLLDPRIERDVAALDGVGGHRARDERAGQHVLGAKKGGKSQRRRDLCSVEERQTLLWREAQRLESGPPERFFAAQGILANPGLPLPDEHSGEVGQRRQVPRRPGGAFGGNPGIDPVLEERRERVDEFQPDPGMTARERRHLHQDHQADDPVPEILADPRSVRTDDVLLELPEFGGVDPHVDQMPAAGVDPVDGTASGDRRVDRAGRGGDPAAGVVAELDRHRVAPGRAQGGEGDRLADLDPHRTMGRFNPCSRAQATASS